MDEISKKKIKGANQRQNENKIIDAADFREARRSGKRKQSR